MQNRVRSISLLHASMHRPGTKATVDLGSYIRLLTAHLVKAHLIPATAIQVVLDVDELTVGMVQATTVGLLVNELVMNCLKHGFPDGGSGEIHKGLQRVGAGSQWRLLVQDNGVGLPADFARRSARRRSDPAIGRRVWCDVHAGRDIRAASSLRSVPTPIRADHLPIRDRFCTGQQRRLGERASAGHR